MAALKTALADIFEPAIWAKYFIELTTDKSLLVQSGIAAATPEVVAAANQGGRTVSMPFWDDLPHDPDTASTLSVVGSDDDTDITATGITTGKDIAVKHFRNKAWSAADIITYLAGEDPISVVLSRYAAWWNRDEQLTLLKTLTGCFADATIASALGNDISVETASTDPANLISSTAIEDTRFLLGDAYDKFTAIIMHSVPFKRLRNLDLINDVPVSLQNPLAGTTPKYMGLDVLADDTMTKVAGSTSGYHYHTFLFGKGAIARVDVPEQLRSPGVELYRQPLAGTGSGNTTVITRRVFILHPRGIAYSGSLPSSAGMSPTNATLAGDSWTQAFQTKNIRIARLITNG